MWLKPITALCLAPFAMVASRPAEGATAEFARRMNTGKAHLENRNSTGAIEAFTAALKLEPKSAPALRNLARAQMLANQNDQAIQCPHPARAGARFRAQTQRGYQSAFRGRDGCDVCGSRHLAYLNRRTCGDGWVIIGDARAFLDPIYSSGLYLALGSAELAAQCIDDAFQHGDVSAARLGRFEPALWKGVDVVRRLIHAFYDPNFSFPKFVQRFPEHRAALAQMTPPPPPLGSNLPQPTERTFATV
jgi:2-polyprenyl-6-methoxyphenol hydroxylase-like FAD-dependent oxidoreductase